MDLLFEDMNKVDKFLSVECAAAQVDFYSDGAHAVVQLGDTSERNLIMACFCMKLFMFGKRCLSVWERKSQSLSLKHILFSALLKTYFTRLKKSEINNGLEKQTD